MYDSAFKTLDARDYSSIATIETRRGVVDISSSINDLQVAVVENSLRYYFFFFLNIHMIKFLSLLALSWADLETSFFSRFTFHIHILFKVSHQFIFRYLVKVMKNEKSAVLVVYFFFQLLKTSFNWEFFSLLTNKKFTFSVKSK